MKSIGVTLAATIAAALLVAVGIAATAWRTDEGRHVMKDERVPDAPQVESVPAAEEPADPRFIGSDLLPGRETAVRVPETHFVKGTPLKGPFPGKATAYFGMGCFWGAERLFWQLEGVHSTSVGYAGGTTRNPTYREVCGGLTGHAEVVKVVFDPEQIGYDELLKVFWESHDPTQGMRQGADLGTQYRSCIYYVDDAQSELALASKERFEAALTTAGRSTITTEIRNAPTFFYAEEYHQQYLGKVPNGYCGIKGTGVTCPADFSKAGSSKANR